MNQEKDLFTELWNELAQEIYECSKQHGFHGDNIQDNVPTKLMLIVSEISEALEADRRKERFCLGSNKIQGWSEFEEELADAVIRIMDLGALLNIDLPGAILAKHEYNKHRPYLHGTKKY